MILRPINVFTLGLSYTSPTFYEMRDESYLFMTADFDSDVLSDDVIFLPLRYNLRTPARVNGGAALFLDKLGFITADVEWVDYSSAKLSSDEFNFDGENNEVNTFESVLNYRAGAELRLKAFRLRAGYSFQADPLNGADGIDRSRESLTAGFGLHFKKFYLDGTYIRGTYNTATVPYPGALTALTENISENAVVTLGFKF